MHRVFIVLLAGALVLGTGSAFAQSRGSSAGARPAMPRVSTAAPAPAVDPNSDFAKRQAAIAQGFAPIDTSALTRGFTR
jgi:hypothetical protein